MSNIKKDNHYVPQVYLKHWAIKGKILTYRLLVPHENCEVWKNHSPGSIAKHQYLYTYFSGSADTDEVEHWLDKDFESPAAVSIAKVVMGNPIKSEDWNNLFRFAVAQSVRTPAGLHQFIERQQKTLQNLISDTLEKSMAKLEDAVKTGVKLQASPSDDVENKPPIKVSRIKNDDGTEGVQVTALNGRKMWIWQLRHVLTYTIYRLPKYRWTILHAPPGMTWPTSDNPLIKICFNAKGEYYLDGGWATPGVQIILPLSPKHLLYTRLGTRPPPKGTTVNWQEASFFRKVILESALRYVFAADPTGIDVIRPRTISQEQCRYETKMWSDWHSTQSKEEAEYPD
ncbi:hypothetical protein CXP47_10505 [Pseudomonas chlororaphis]|uniref:DUF4238 domain-containing protein n=1 Tax=Pseudomonas chlororaphis TaxID=587753 RepID=A0AAP9VYB8_9PSED|nr:DUF4238 domain-containing protein [Pseudomonas chlororaphis]AUG40286.1 hypothetical protein CXP47_10505 [Pseudomonas chlororaphis]QNR49894.1 DUF4238 domain-containing protein [Pseudomonas chlororaphis]